MATKLKSVSEDVGTMLPTIGLDGKALTKDPSSDFEIKGDNDDSYKIIFTESVIEYINNPESEYDFEVEEGVKNIVSTVTERISVGGTTGKLVVQIYLLKKKIKRAEKKGNSKKAIDLKRELVSKQLELNKLKKSSSPSMQKDIESIEKNLEKNTPKISTSSVNVTTESSNSDKDKKDEKPKTLPPELKRLDEIRGQIEDLKDKREEAKDKYIKTGEKSYENKIIGLTAKIDKLQDELAKKEEKAKKLEDKIAKESVIIENFDDPKFVQINNKIDALTARINRNERAQSAYQAKYGEENKSLYKEHDKLCDEMEKLCNERRNYGKNVNEAAEMEDEIRPIVEELNRKGYKVKYSSPGHKKLRKKEDKEPDGVYYDKLYSDARIMFDDKYDFPDAPEYWHWREVDGCSYLDISPYRYNEKDGSPDEAFTKWKTNYMNSLRTFVKNLKNKSNKEIKESTDEFSNSFMKELFEKMGFDELGLDDKYVQESVGFKEENNNDDVLKELYDLLS